MDDPERNAVSAPPRTAADTLPSTAAPLLVWLASPAALLAQPACFWTRLGLWHERIVDQQIYDEPALTTLFERHGLVLVQTLWAWSALPASTLSLSGQSAGLARHLAQNASQPWAQTLLLIAHLMQNRRYDAVSAASRLLLPPAALGAVRAAGLTARGERLALALLLYGENPEHLTLLTLYERAERFGYARHLAALNGCAGNMPAAAAQPFDRAGVNCALEGFEQSARGGGRSLCLAVLASDDGAHIVFIRRVLREATIQELDRTLFGDEAELIVLKFSQRLQVLEEHSTRGVGLAIGEAIASRLLDHPVHYVSDDTLTPESAVRTFLEQVQDAGNDAALWLIELHLRQAPLDGSPSLTLRSPYDRPLGGALQALADHQIHLLDDLHNIRSITLAFCPPANGPSPHQFKVAFAHTAEGVVLHYSGAQSSLALRKEFEQHLEDAYAVAVIPTGL